MIEVYIIAASIVCTVGTIVANAVFFLRIYKDE